MFLLFYVRNFLFSISDFRFPIFDLSIFRLFGFSFVFFLEGLRETDYIRRSLSRSYAQSFLGSLRPLKSEDLSGEEPWGALVLHHHQYFISICIGQHYGLWYDIPGIQAAVSFYGAISGCDIRKRVNSRGELSI